MKTELELNTKFGKRKIEVESCIIGECMELNCILNKWKKYVKEEKEEIQSTEND